MPPIKESISAQTKKHKYLLNSQYSISHSKAKHEIDIFKNSKILKKKELNGYEYDYTSTGDEEAKFEDNSGEVTTKAGLIGTIDRYYGCISRVLFFLD